MLERKWPEKYNGPGHVRWAGRIYGDGLTYMLGWRRPRVYHGVWGVAPFQSLYQPASSLLGSLPQMPEWHLMTASLAGIAALSVAWKPFTLAVPLLVAAIVPPIAQAWLRDRKSTRLNSSHSQISYAVFCLKKKKKRICTGHAKSVPLCLAYSLIS